MSQTSHIKVGNLHFKWKLKLKHLYISKPFERQAWSLYKFSQILLAYASEFMLVKISIPIIEYKTLLFRWGHPELEWCIEVVLLLHRPMYHLTISYQQETTVAQVGCVHRPLLFV